MVNNKSAGSDGNTKQFNKHYWAEMNVFVKFCFGGYYKSKMSSS